MATAVATRGPRASAPRRARASHRRRTITAADPTAPPRPALIVSAEVCPLSGKLPGPHCRHRKRELFVVGRVPTERCDWHAEVCGQPAIVYPDELRGWTQVYRPARPPTCAAAAAPGPLTIVAPVAGARFVLEPHRPATAQRPPLIAQPDGAELRWTIDGEPAERWVPTPGSHEVVARRGAEVAAVTIRYD